MPLHRSVYNDAANAQELKPTSRFTFSQPADIDMFSLGIFRSFNWFYPDIVMQTHWQRLKESQSAEASLTDESNLRLSGGSPTAHMAQPPERKNQKQKTTFSPEGADLSLPIISPRVQ